MQQEDVASKENGRWKRHYFVSAMKAQVDYRIFQMTSGGESAQPKALDPDKQLSKLQWEKALADWRIQIRQLLEMQDATLAPHWRLTPRRTASTKAASSVRI